MFQDDGRKHRQHIGDERVVVEATTASYLDHRDVDLLLIEPAQRHRQEDPGRAEILRWCQAGDNGINGRREGIQNAQEIRFRDHATVNADPFTVIEQMRAGDRTDGVTEMFEDIRGHRGHRAFAFAACNDRVFAAGNEQ